MLELVSFAVLLIVYLCFILTSSSLENGRADFIPGQNCGTRQEIKSLERDQDVTNMDSCVMVNNKRALQAWNDANPSNSYQTN